MGVVRRTLLIGLLAALSACVERRLFVRTEPEGAVVRVNGDAIGRSPTTWHFHHYGTVVVEAELEGHEPAQELVDLDAPWYQWPVIAFFADVLIPWTIRDDRDVSIRLEPVPPPDESAEQRERRVRREMAELEEGAIRLRAEAEAQEP
jgi:hypothetical protein